MSNEACQNEDRQLWQESDENGHRSLHVTKDGGIGINVGGNVWVMPLAKWHKLAVNSEALTTENKGEDNMQNMEKLIGELNGWLAFVNKQLDDGKIPIDSNNTYELAEILSHFTPTENKGGDMLTEYEGVLQEITNMGIIRMDGKAYVSQDRVLDILSRPASPTKADKVEPLAVKLLKELVSALQWCSASEDFQKDGKARIGWEHICIPALFDTRAFLTGPDDVNGKGGRV